ncbi:MAG: class I SAM-dependent RNA methyltransferase [Tissierellia bacterium]|nr:class I SAM-dependent RNA methyltransferase [Tissierellia bacterium]
MYKLKIRCSFGLEAVIKRQLLELGYNDLNVKDGEITLLANTKDISILNLYLRCADRIYIELNSFKAMSFEELFENINKMEWSDYFTQKTNFIVNANSHKSKLYSLRDIQSICEKAIIESLKRKYNISFFEKSNERASLEISIIKNIVSVNLDTSGDSLHKRGYRNDTVKAPLRENLAAGLVDLSFYNSDRFLYDPFCGSGTILIEAARKERNIPSGIDRDFDFTEFKFIDKSIFNKVRKEAFEKINYDKKLHILGSDISGRAIELAKNNAINAGVEEDIDFITRDFKNVNIKDDYGIIITNPPYGKRLSNTNLNKLYKEFNRKFKDYNTLSFYIITADEKFDKFFSKKLSRKRKLYNGNIKTTYYQYYGAKPKHK